MPITRDALLSDTQVRRSLSSSSHSQSDDISAKSRMRASLARSARAVAISLAFCSAWRRNCRPMTPNSTAKPDPATSPPSAITADWTRQAASAMGSCIETSTTTGHAANGRTDTTDGTVPR
jgi:hypothetical protein